MPGMVKFHRPQVLYGLLSNKNWKEVLDEENLNYFQGNGRKILEINQRYYTIDGDKPDSLKNVLVQFEKKYVNNPKDPTQTAYVVKHEGLRVLVRDIHGLQEENNSIVPEELFEI